MKRSQAIWVGAAALGLMASGGAVTAAWQDVPQDARSGQDPIGDIIRETQTQTPSSQAPSPQTPATPEEPAPAGDPAPAAPIIIIPTEPLVVAELPGDEEAEEEAETAEVPEKIAEPVVPTRRQRRRVAIVEAIDKVTARSMRFEVEVGGRPVRFNKQLLVTARACEVSAPEELVADAVAYLDISVEPRSTARGAETRQVFRGWMFASTPAVSGLEHSGYDAWVIGCKA